MIRTVPVHCALRGALHAARWQKGVPSASNREACFPAPVAPATHHNSAAALRKEARHPLSSLFHIHDQPWAE